MSYYNSRTTRLPGYNYSTPGYYFITMCTENIRPILGSIVGTGLLDGPSVALSPYGKVVAQQLDEMSDFYSHIKIDKYVVMPNHVHMILHIPESLQGPSGRPIPTNATVGKFVGTFKRFCNRQYGHNIWQSRSYDHVIRNEQDYLRIWQYIESNPARWKEDKLYTE